MKSATTLEFFSFTFKNLHQCIVYRYLCIATAPKQADILGLNVTSDILKHVVFRK